MTRFGGNEFTSFSVPLVFCGRYFVLEPGNPAYLSVFLEVDGVPVFEVLKNEPVQNSHSGVSKSAAGIVTVSDRTTGRFLYKVRPGYRTSIAFGTLHGGEVSAHITDTKLRVAGVTLKDGLFDGVRTGVTLREDGGLSICSTLPPIVATLLATPS